MTQPAPQQARRVQGLSQLIHGAAKAGKSSMADSGPQPRVVVDVEGTATWTPSRKKDWDPLREPPPQPGRHLTAGYGQPSITPAWETALVIAREPRVVAATYQVLNSGRHPFNSAAVDSITEMQQRFVDEMVGTRQMEQKHWGAMLRQLSGITRQWRDLIIHPVKPLWSVTFVAGTHYDRQMGKWRPLVQGQSQDYLPYYVDLLGYLEAFPDGSRWLITGPHKTYETGERVGGRLPYAMPIAYPGRPGWTAETMVQHVISGG